jgi:hypothetical protein
MTLNIKLLSVLLVLILVGTFYYNKSTIEQFELQMNGILPKNRHPTRLGNIIYYNDPIFIKLGQNNVQLTMDKALGGLDKSLTQITYLMPKTAVNGLTPVSYMDSLWLKVFPDGDFNKKYNIEFQIIPFNRPSSNQQPYLQVNDLVSFKTDKNEYLCINPLSKQFELFNSNSPPNNAIFKILNSPQCYINRVKYGVDMRGQSSGTISSIRDQLKSHLDNQVQDLDTEENTIRALRKKEAYLKEHIELSNVNKEILQKQSLDTEENTIRSLRQKDAYLKENIERSNVNREILQKQMGVSNADYESTLDNIRDKNSTIRLDNNKDFARKINNDKKIVNNYYNREKKGILDRGCA